MPNLSRRLAEYFSRSACAMGAQHHARGRVEIVIADSTTVLTNVHEGGTIVFKPGFYFRGGRLYVNCDCPSYRPHQLCEHLWAALLETDELDLFPRSYFSAKLKPVDLDDFRSVAYDDDDPDDSAGLLPAPPKPSPWRSQIHVVSDSLRRAPAPPRSPWPDRREILYSIPVQIIPRDGASFTLELLYRDQKKSGVGFTKPKPLRLRDPSELPDPADREIVALLQGATEHYDFGPYYSNVPTSWQISGILAATLLPRIAQSGHLVLRGRDDEEIRPLAWDPADPWSVNLALSNQNGEWILDGHFFRAGETLPLDKPSAVLQSGFLIGPVLVAPLHPSAPFEWLLALRQHGAIRAPESEREDFLAAIFEQTNAPNIDLPETLQIESVSEAPVPALRIQNEPRYSLRLDLSFRYGDTILPIAESRRALFDPAASRLLRRDFDSEQRAAAKLGQLATICYEAGPADPHWHAPNATLSSLISTVVSEGWLVDLNGVSFRAPGVGSLSITSGIDWFDLEGSVDYGGATARLPALLQALKRKENYVQLDDGTYGLLPTEWLSRLQTLASMGDLSKDHLRFNRSQAGFLDALLATQPEVSFDEGFAHARNQLTNFKGVAAADQPSTFVGTLREYQREGLGWLHFLDNFALGGCLADDMGVGKTVQVLALLESRRTAPDRKAPFLVVVPRSLVFNWTEEAARFTPSMRVLAHSGISRSIDRFADYDLILTTYGTVRRDAAALKDIEFDYVILDEAQAIKNAATDTAKAVRLLRARRRLAMSGTPVENHLGELWSLFEFLNPGMLGGAKVLRNAAPELRNPSEDTRLLLGHALRPYILRRTKSQVATELPDKTEQTVFCELDTEQRRLYNEMREYYRNSLLSRVDQQGMAKSKMHVLEALLRLRQIACHPGLIDPKRKADSSAKLDALIDYLESVLEEGHKALVFSQFTSMLAIVKDRLDKSAIPYEYLDGQTRDRQARVERFQNDPGCRLFLVSLKAGGLGLNLTAAEYVFILDPWWNPAVESQAIDRAHRIGQTNQVFAYRLIAKDTVEEKVLELQKTKRNLADAIIGADNSLVRGLKRDDLELLLS